MSEVSDPMNNLRAYTDYPITELGDAPNQTAPVRKVVLLSYDGDKYARVLVQGITKEIKLGYLYESEGRYGEVGCVSGSSLAPKTTGI